MLPYMPHGREMATSSALIYNIDITMKISLCTYRHPLTEQKNVDIHFILTNIQNPHFLMTKQKKTQLAPCVAQLVAFSNPKSNDVTHHIIIFHSCENL